ncbi:hypothetical protein N665_0016s0032 [Sinapis alba]|nr:hypothetical protein N665_0016s0032 [Sinapis alba]
MLANCKITRSLVDTGRSVNVIYKDTLDKIKLPDLQIKPSKQPLMGFNGSLQNVVGFVRLLNYVGGVMFDTKFTIIDSPDMYNIILITPWIHAMRAVPSTYH